MLSVKGVGHTKEIMHPLWYIFGEGDPFGILPPLSLEGPGITRLLYFSLKLGTRHLEGPIFLLVIYLKNELSPGVVFGNYTHPVKTHWERKKLYGDNLRPLGTTMTRRMSDRILPKINLGGFPTSLAGQKRLSHQH